MNGKTGIDCKSGAELCQGKALISKFAPTKKEKAMHTGKIIFFMTSILMLLVWNPVFSLADGKGREPHRHALVVGIGKYPAGSGWSKINGDRDITLVVRMLVRNGFEKSDIIVLANSDATRKAIEKAFERLEESVSAGDIVYIHFSGHGQQVTDIDGDEPDGLDEAFIPYDAGKVYSSGVYEGENHIIDDDLNDWLSELKAAVGQKGMVLVSMDACHSGDATRGIDDDIVAGVRGTADVFVLPDRESEESEDRGSGSMSNSRTAKHTAGASGTDAFENGGWICISACKSYQNNNEFKSSEGCFGRLTWALYKTLEPGMTLDELVAELQEMYDTMPPPPGPPQNLDVAAPENISGPLF